MTDSRSLSACLQVPGSEADEGLSNSGALETLRKFDVYNKVLRFEQLVCLVDSISLPGEVHEDYMQKRQLGGAVTLVTCAILAVLVYCILDALALGFSWPSLRRHTYVHAYVHIHTGSKSHLLPELLFDVVKVTRGCGCSLQYSTSSRTSYLQKTQVRSANSLVLRCSTASLHLDSIKKLHCMAWKQSLTS